MLPRTLGHSNSACHWPYSAQAGEVPWCSDRNRIWDNNQVRESSRLGGQFGRAEPFYPDVTPLKAVVGFEYGSFSAAIVRIVCSEPLTDGNSSPGSGGPDAYLSALRQKLSKAAAPSSWLPYCSTGRSSRDDEKTVLSELVPTLACLNSSSAGMLVFWSSDSRHNRSL
jgi:hypothetical protein